MDFNELFKVRPVDEPEVVDIEPETAPEAPKKYRVKVTHSSLRMRKAPNLQAEIAGYIQDEGYYDIVDEANGWGKLENGNWIMLSYTEIAY